MKNNFNSLIKYIYDYSYKTYHKDSIDSLFCSVLEPLTQYQSVEACVFIRVLDKTNKDSIFKRMEFSKVRIFNFYDIERWGDTEFLVVLSGRYSAALIWDYSDNEIKNYSKTCLLYNSKIILDISKLIVEHSENQEIKGLLKKYSPDRRENILLNKSIQKIVSDFDDKNRECIAEQYENIKPYSLKTELETAKIVTDKAKFISHEIKNQLSIINLYSKIVNKRLERLNSGNIIKDNNFETINQINSSLKNITNASENISYLISDLRCMSAVYLIELNLKDVIIETVELCKIKTETLGINLNFDYEMTYNQTVKTDKVRVQCAIINIIFNAIEANAKKISIILKGTQIFIKNDGMEIPQSLQKQIFKENFTTKQHGNGIGLGFCKSQLQEAGGDINLISSTKQETIFAINIVYHYQK